MHYCRTVACPMRLEWRREGQSNSCRQYDAPGSKTGSAAFISLALSCLSKIPLNAVNQLQVTTKVSLLYNGFVLYKFSGGADVQLCRECLLCEDQSFQSLEFRTLQHVVESAQMAY